MNPGVQVNNMNIPIWTSQKLVAFITGFLVLFVIASEADAQTRKKKRRTVRKPVVTRRATYPPVTDPSVVSRADDYDDQTSQIVEPLSQTPLASLPVSDSASRRLKDLQSRVKKLETTKTSDYDDRQKRLLLNLDILTRAEQRSESLRRQRFELVEKENTIRSRMDQIDIDSRSETIEKSVALAGSLRPEELRDARRKSLEAEKRNLQSLLTDVQATRANLDQTVLRADALVEKLRLKLEKDIDDALETKEPEN